ncbi:hypothetical protein Pla175_03150 [Pirellulimonas nuda]|uniref:Uncharacterized protein n=1 Tax=Pirellulimonas nuda TaxID=2528009 RepID=A0A518D664_9BACT|nr:hypothetical protein [Pirellulimonas nuda]QDU86961.1 hypothetical protein Pla175_03150 [Pirellulimonas nuda]
MVRCACGAQIQAPKLSQLRELPIAEAAAPAGPPSAWGFAQGALSAGILAAVALVALAGYLYWTEPPKPEPFSAEVFSKNAAEQISQAPPAMLFNIWHGRYLPLAVNGLAPMENPGVERVEQQIAQARSYEMWLLAAAAVAAAVGAAAYFASRPAQRGRTGS